MGILKSLNRWSKNEQRKEILKKYEGEPIFQTMEKLMLAMKAFYQKNGWIFIDTEAMAVLNDQRDEYEKSVEKINLIADEQKKQAHNDLEEKMNRQLDKELLKLQYRSMIREYHTIRKLAKLKKGKYAIDD